MSKKVTFTLDEDIAEKFPEEMKIDDVVLNQAINLYLQSEKQNQQLETTMVTESKINKLEAEKTRIEQERQALEIDNECLKQEKKKLQSRIDDLAELYPSASVLLGKKPTIDKRKKPRFKNNIFKK
jgi:seryl-tRNA(Sec) selenium transferase